MSKGFLICLLLLFLPTTALAESGWQGDFAVTTKTDTLYFNGNLSATDETVQDALDTIDDLDTFTGTLYTQGIIDTRTTKDVSLPILTVGNDVVTGIFYIIPSAPVAPSISLKYNDVAILGWGAGGISVKDSIYIRNPDYIYGTYITNTASQCMTLGDSENFTIDFSNVNKILFTSDSGITGFSFDGYDLTASKLGVLESGSNPTKYTYLQGGDQSDDITYTLPTASSDGFLRNTSNALSWDTLDVADITDIGTYYVALDASNDPITNTLEIKPPTDTFTGLYINQYDSPYCTATGETIMDAGLKVFRITAKTVTAGEYNTGETFLVANANQVSISADNWAETSTGSYGVVGEAGNSYTGIPAEGKALTYSEIGYYGISGYNVGGMTVTVAGGLTEEEEYYLGNFTHYSIGLKSLSMGNVTLNSSTLNYNGFFIGMDAATQPTVNNDLSSDHNIYNFAMRGIPQSTELANEVLRGGYFDGTDSATGYGIETKGGQGTTGGAVLAYGNIDFTNDDTFNIGSATAKPDSIWTGHLKSDTSLEVVQMADIASGNFVDFGMDTGISLTASSGTQSLVRFSGDINQSGTAGFTVFEIAATKTSEGSGDRLLYKLSLDAQEIYAIDQQGTHRISGVGTGVIGGIADNSGGWMSIFGGTYGVMGGSSIEYPIVPGNGFYYGFAGVESHMFGMSGDLTIDYLGNLSTVSTVSAGYLQTGSQIGIAADQDLLGLASNALTINGSAACTQFGLPSILAGTDLYSGRSQGAFGYVYFWNGASFSATNTTEAAQTRGTAFTLLADNLDYTYCGKATTFSAIRVDIATAATGNTMTWDYSTGTSSWATLTVSDGTSALSADGTITFTPPVDWALGTVNGASAYWVRIGSSTSSNPDGTAYIVSPNSNKVLGIYGNPSDTNPIFGVDANGCGIVTNVATAATFLSTIACAGMTSTAAITASLAVSAASSSGIVAGESGAASATTPVRYSPRILRYGRGWDTDGAGSSEVEYFQEEIRPISGATVTSSLWWGHAPTSTTMTDIMKLSSVGVLGIDHIAELTGSHTITFDNNITQAVDIKHYFGDTNVSIYSNDDGYLDLEADAGIRINNFIRNTSANYRRYYHLPLGSFDPGASGAAWTAPSATSIGGYQLDAAGEKLYFDADVHSDWDGASNIDVEIYFAVNVDNLGGGAGDTVDLKLVPYYNSTGDTTTKTQTVEVATVIGASAQYKVFKSEFEINWDETDNVVEAGDLMRFILNLETDTSEVDDIIILHGSYYYNTKHVGVESGDV